MLSKHATISHSIIHASPKEPPSPPICMQSHHTAQRMTFLKPPALHHLHLLALSTAQDKTAQKGPKRVIHEHLCQKTAFRAAHMQVYLTCSDRHTAWCTAQAHPLLFLCFFYILRRILWQIHLWKHCLARVVDVS